mgnify:CR=1 FL=1
MFFYWWDIAIVSGVFILTAIGLIAQNYSLKKQDAYIKYRTWTVANGYKTTSSSKFGSELFRIFGNVTKKDYRHASGDRARAWPGLTWIILGSVQEQQASQFALCTMTVP